MTRDLLKSGEHLERQGTNINSNLKTVLNHIGEKLGNENIKSHTERNICSNRLCTLLNCEHKKNVICKKKLSKHSCKECNMDPKLISRRNISPELRVKCTEGSGESLGNGEVTATEEETERSSPAPLTTDDSIKVRRRKSNCGEHCCIKHMMPSCARDKNVRHTDLNGEQNQQPQPVSTKNKLIKHCDCAHGDSFEPVRIQSLKFLIIY